MLILTKITNDRIQKMDKTIVWLKGVSPHNEHILTLKVRITFLIITFN